MRADSARTEPRRAAFRLSIMAVVSPPGGFGYLISSSAIRISQFRVSVCELGTPGKFVIVLNGTETVTRTAAWLVASVVGVAVTVAVAFNCGASAVDAW